MTSVILSTICALALGAASPSAQADTTDVYVIDYVEVKDFDGSQLVGQSISTYNINLTTSGSQVVRRHIIKTVLSGNNVDVETTGAGGWSSGLDGLVSLSPEEMNNAVFFLNGARVSRTTFNYMDPGTISDTKILQGEEAYEYLQSLKKNKEYDGITEGRSVVLVTTKPRN